MDNQEELNKKLDSGMGGVDTAQYFSKLKKMITNLSKEIGIKEGEMHSSIWIFTVPIQIPGFFYKTKYHGKERHFNWLKNIAKKAADVTCPAEHIERIFSK